jgi:hypothetical protein
MLDLHSVYDSTGSTDTIVAENNSNAVIPTNDGATTIGVSPFNNAVLVAFGAQSLNGGAQGIVSVGLQGNNIVDPTNKMQFTATGTDVMAVKSIMTQVGYSNGPNLVNYAQEAAGIITTHKLDLVQGPACTGGSYTPAGQAIYPATFSQLTAGAYGSKSFAPTNAPPIGRYAVLGAWVSALTAGAALRFDHTDFKGAKPGFPVVDYATAALTPSQIQGGGVFSPEAQGYQFVWLSQKLGVASCPVFTVQGQGTGLNIQCIDGTADTPTVILNLQKVG